jgi:hypothetical protein
MGSGAAGSATIAPPPAFIGIVARFALPELVLASFMPFSFSFRISRYRAQADQSASLTVEGSTYSDEMGGGGWNRTLVASSDVN